MAISATLDLRQAHIMPGLTRHSSGSLTLVSLPDSVPFNITASTEGDYVEGIDFTLRKILPPVDTSVMPVAVVPSVQKDTTYMVVHEVIRELVTITEDYYAVQFGAFQNKAYAEIMKKKVEGALDKKVELFEEDGFWKVRITGFADREDLDSYIPIIQGQGINQIWVIMNRAVKQDYRTTVREDSVARIRETVTERAEPVNITGTSYRWVHSARQTRAPQQLTGFLPLPRRWYFKE